MSDPVLEVCIRLERPAFTLDVDLALPGRGVTVLFGRSGAGKTTLLRCIAGLETAPGARIAYDGRSWQVGPEFIPAHRRPIGYVFQEASLFSHLDVRGNLEFAAKRADPESAGLTSDDAIELFDLQRLLRMRSDALSGGERQRVAIARALLIRPRVLLMDEPLASLDQPRKNEILPYLETLKSEVALPIVYVTHAFEEVARLADHLVALEAGRAVTTGTLAETLPRLDFPIDLGDEAGVVLDARIAEIDAHWRLARADADGLSLWLPDRNFTLGKPVRVRVFARDVSLALAPHEDTSIVNVLPARITAIEARADAPTARVVLALGPQQLLAHLTRRSLDHLRLQIGSEVWAQIKSVAIVR